MGLRMMRILVISVIVIPPNAEWNSLSLCMAYQMRRFVLMHLCSCAIVRQYITCLNGNCCVRCDVSSTISAADYWQVTRHLFTFFANSGL